jgi:excisionase family DNA binding protein
LHVDKTVRWKLRTARHYAEHRRFPLVHLSIPEHVRFSSRFRHRRCKPFNPSCGMLDDACRTIRSRGARASGGIDRLQGNKATRSRREDDSLQISFNQEPSANRLNEASHSRTKVGLGFPVHEQAGNIPAWALHPSTETSAAQAVPEDRSIAPDRTGTSSFPRALPLLSVDDVAERLNVSTKTIRRLIARRRLRATRIGRVIRIQEADVEYLIATGTMS